MSLPAAMQHLGVLVAAGLVRSEKIGRVRTCAIEPQVLSLRNILDHFIDHRKEVIRRRAEFELAKARDRAKILRGFRIALDNIDEVISIIRASATVDEAKANLMARFPASITPPSAE